MKKIIVNQSRGRLYCLIKKKYVDYWMYKKIQKFVKGNDRIKDRTVIIYDLSNNIKYSH